jgi:hypothetical protein
MTCTETPTPISKSAYLVACEDVQAERWRESYSDDISLQASRNRRSDIVQSSVTATRSAIAFHPHRPRISFCSLTGGFSATLTGTEPI